MTATLTRRPIYDPAARPAAGAAPAGSLAETLGQVRAEADQLDWDDPATPCLVRATVAQAMTAHGAPATGPQYARVVEWVCAGRAS